MNTLRSHIKLCFLLLLCNWVVVPENLTAQSREFDSLMDLLPSVNSNDKVDLLIKLGDNAIHLDFNKRMEYYRKAIELAKENNYIEGEALAWYQWAIRWAEQNQPDKSLKYLNNALNLYKKARNEERILRCKISIADQYSDLADNRKALDIYNEVVNDKNITKYKHLQAIAYNNAGLVYNSMGLTDSALMYFIRAKDINLSLKDSSLLGNLYNNIGMVYGNSGKYDSCLAYFQLAYKVFEKQNDRKHMVNALVNIGILYRMFQDYAKALKYQYLALKQAEKLQDERILANIHNSLGVIYGYVDSIEKQIEHYKASLDLYKKIGDKQGEERSYLNIGNTFSAKKEYAKANEYFRQAININKITKNIINRVGELQMMGLNYYYQGKYDSASGNYFKALQLARNSDMIDYVQKLLQFIALNYEGWGKYDSALMYYRQYQEVKDSIYTQTKIQQIAELETKYETEKKEAQIKLQKAILERKTIENKRQVMLIVFLGIVFFLVAWGVIIVFRSLRQKQRDHEIIRTEKEKSEKLLLNILPRKIANDLKTTGKTEPESFDNVTVFFSDVLNFTQLSEETHPETLVERLNEMFTAFDDIMIKHNCERIKTIGDAYLAVSGMPVPDPNHAENMLDAALEIMKFMHEFNRKSNMKFLLRIGINSGKVVGGVVGVRKYIYDVFGDTINTASRMKDNSEAMKINVSDATKQCVNNKYVFEEREEISVKGKGKMKMWFLIEKNDL